MPTYEYRCHSCGEKFDQYQSITAEPVKDCPKCSATGSVERLISAGSGLLFKGSGFYITDYRSPSYQESAKKDSGGSSSSPASSDSKSSSSSTAASSSATTSSTSTSKGD